MTKSLLEKAKEIKTRINAPNKLTPEKVELAAAWAKGDVVLSQVRRILGNKSHNSVYIFLALALQKYIKDGCAIKK